MQEPVTEALIQSVRRISEAVGRSDYRAAYDLAEAALADGAIHPALFRAKALWLERNGRDEEALTEFERALSLASNDVATLNAIGLCLFRLLRPQEAVSSFDEAIRINPLYTASYYRKGLALALAGDHEGARVAHERAVALNPRNADALASLASIAARRGELDSARALAGRALSINRNQPTAHYALALVELERANFSDAEQRLRQLAESKELNPQARASVLASIGDALDGQGRYPEAFQAYLEEKSLLQQLRIGHGFRASAASLIDDLIAEMEAASAISATPAPDAEAAAATPETHVFLLGFPRSGTTLLGRVLAESSKVSVLDEKDTLRGLTAAANAGTDRLSRFRQRYWEGVRERGINLQSQTIFVDKQPLATLKLPAIARLFPRAKILFLLRDPRDVILSCFRHLFRVNVLIPDFLTLEGTAHYYVKAMRLAELCRRKLPLNVHACRYEAIVDDFDGTLRAICEFIGAEWTDSMRLFHQTTRVTDLRSPSATQVRRPLYRAIGHWRHYRHELEPILPILEPWIEAFGYPTE